MTHAVDTAQALEKARSAFEVWSTTDIEKRLGLVTNLRRLILQRLDTVLGVIRESTGKVEVEALNADILPTLEMIRYYEKKAARFLQPQKRKTPFIFLKNYSYLEYKPLGVVLIISPWNYPFQLSLVPLVSALIAGNTVLLKPAEITAKVGTLIQDLMDEAGFPPGVAQVIIGGRAVGEELIHACPDKILFTGSVGTGRHIAEAAAQDLVPVVLELGGKDPMVVFEDALLDRAVEAAVYGAFANSGQLCVSVERVYVQDTVYEQFAARVAARAAAVRVGTGPDCDIGPMTTASQLQVVLAQVEEAVAQGAKPLTELRHQGLLFYPLVLRDVTHAMRIMQEETFGPVLPLMPFGSEAEAVALANDTMFGLNASVWSQDLEKAKRVVRRLVTGNAYINDVVKNIGNPDLPFGGVRQSGFGKYHGPEGLRTFSLATAVMVSRNRARREINWFPYTPRLASTVRKLITMRYADIPFRQRLKIFLSLRDMMKE